MTNAFSDQNNKKMSENSLTVLFSEIYDDLCTKFNISKIADFYFREGDYFEGGGCNVVSLFILILRHG
jgi:hypothetical protein